GPGRPAGAAPSAWRCGGLPRGSSLAYGGTRHPPRAGLGDGNPPPRRGGWRYVNRYNQVLGAGGATREARRPRRAPEGRGGEQGAGGGGGRKGGGGGRD